jgi:hypothetical protein
VRRSAAARAKGAATIHFVPNDPTHVELARDERPVGVPKGSATVTVTPAGHEVYWQAKEALDYGLTHWCAVRGRPLEGWQGRRKSLPVALDVGEDLNANYDRQQLNFYHYDFPSRRVFSAASPDVTCHEQGHALLDALRPDFWGAPYLEIAAFHEAWGDCMAMLVAFADPAQCKAALAEGLDNDNLVSNLAEDLASAICELGHPEAVDGAPPRPALRKALNAFRYTDPQGLPGYGPARELQSEPHSFSRVFSGCFYDVIRNLFASAGAKTVKRLQEAAHLAGELLVAAAETTPLVPWFFPAVAERFLQADAQLHEGLHAAEIRAAFGRHGLFLGAPKMSLALPVLPWRAGVSRGAADEPLLLRLGLEAAPSEGLQYTPVRSSMHGEMAHVSGFQSEDVSDLNPALKGVHALVPATARVKLEGPSVLGLLGEATTVGVATRAAARQFVRSLLETGHLEAEPGGPRLPASPPRRPGPPTHAIRSVDGQRVVVRTRFAC